MKHLSRALSLAALVCATVAQANHFDSNSLSLNVGPTFNYARFKAGELNGSTSNLPKVAGYMAGIHADLTYEHACHLFARLRFDGRWNAGDITRFDFVTVPGELNAERFKVRDFRPEFNIGYTFGLGDCCDFEVTPFTGVGLIYLQTHARNRPNAPLAERRPQDRRYNVYVPVGVQLDWARSDCFSVGLIAEYRIGVWDRFERRNENVNPVTKNKVDLNRANSFLVEVPLTWAKETCHCFDWQFKVVPYFDWTRWGGLKRNQETPITNADVRLRQWYVGLHVDFGINF